MGAFLYPLHEECGDRAGCVSGSSSSERHYSVLRSRKGPPYRSSGGSCSERGADWWAPRRTFFGSPDRGLIVRANRQEAVQRMGPLARSIARAKEKPMQEVGAALKSKGNS